MAGKRKLISLHTGCMRKDERERREYEEKLIASTGEDLDSVPPSMFVNAAARKEYARALKRLREEIGLVGNLNRSDLISYANAYGRYTDLVKRCREKGFEYTITTRNGPKQNPIVRMMNEARRDMAASSERLGMTVSGQLKAAKAKVDLEEAEMEAKFGSI